MLSKYLKSVRNRLDAFMMKGKRGTWVYLRRLTERAALDELFVLIFVSLIFGAFEVVFLAVRRVVRLAAFSSVAVWVLSVAA